MNDDTLPLDAEVQRPWRRFLEEFEPLRADLYRYCRFLTRSPWDAEDLVQDVLARAFVTLGTESGAPANPRAWLFRVASNHWLNQVKRGRLAPLQALETEVAAGAPDVRGPREAAGSLVECAGGEGEQRVARIRTYFHTPEAVAELCRELGLPCRTNGYRYW